MRHRGKTWPAACLAAALCALLLAGCAGPAAPTPAPTAPPQSAPPPPPESAAPPPEGSPAAPEGAWEGAFDAETLFIGDSLTYHLIIRLLEPEGCLGEASAMAVAGSGLVHLRSEDWRMTPTRYNMGGVYCDEAFEGLSFAEAIAQSAGRYDRVYFLMGSNGSGDVTQADYEYAARLLLEAYPGATVYMQTPPGRADGPVDIENVRACLTGAVEALRAEGCEGLRLLDTASAWDGGYLTRGGVHLTDEGLRVWLDYLVAESFAPAAEDARGLPAAP